MHVHVDPGYAVTYAGQVAAITAASLFGRDEYLSLNGCAFQGQFSHHCPWAGEKLDEVVMRTLKAADPYGRYEQRPSQTGDLRLVLGPDGDGLVIHGSGWSAYCGRKPSPIPLSYELNPFGAAFAVVAAASRLPQVMQAATIEPIFVDTYTWGTDLASSSGTDGIV